MLQVVKAYFDGSKTEPKYVTLAGVIADETTWREVLDNWEEVRKTRGDPPFIHMTDLMALKGEFKTWSEEDRDYLIDGLLNVLLFFRGSPRLRQFTCSVDLGALRRLRLERRLPSAERLCARMVFPHVMNWYAELPGLDIGKLEAYFDRNEQFMRHIEPDWRNKEIRKRHPQWELVKSINQAEMQSTSALQLADVIAWGRNRLESGSHWQTDPHYTTAVRAAGSLQGIHRPCSESALAGFHYREEGYAAIDRQRIKQEQKMANASEEFKKFDRMMRELIHARHDEMKTKSDAQKTKRTKSRKS